MLVHGGRVQAKRSRRSRSSTCEGSPLYSSWRRLGAGNYDRLRRDCDAIGIRGEPAITVALRKCLDEIVVWDLHAREDPGYGGLCAGHDLYEAAWFSAHIRRKMYLKFSLFDERLIIVSFHESTKT